MVQIGVHYSRFYKSFAAAIAAFIFALIDLHGFSVLFVFPTLEHLEENAHQTIDPYYDFDHYFYNVLIVLCVRFRFFAARREDWCQ